MLANIACLILSIANSLYGLLKTEDITILAFQNN